MAESFHINNLQDINSGIKDEQTKNEVDLISRRDFLTLISVTAAVVVGIDKFGRKLELSEDKAFADPLASVIRGIQVEYSNTDWKADPELWANSIRNGCEKAGLPQTKENLCMILTLIRSSSGFKEIPPAAGEIPSPPETSFKAVKKQWTAGPMEVNSGYVMNLEDIPEEEALKKLNTREDGIYYGVMMLKEILRNYGYSENNENKLMCVFADWNAGKGISIRAGLQSAVSEITGINIHKSGRLLRQDYKTKKIPMVEALVGFERFGLSEEEVMGDLKKPTSELINSNTWNKVEEVLGYSIEPFPADLEVPGLVGFLKELFWGEGTSLGYAKGRLREYKKIAGDIAQGRLDASPITAQS